MTIHFGSDVRDKRDDETLLEYYLYIRDKELQQGTKQDITCAWNSFQRFLNTKNYQIEDIQKREVIQWCEYLKKDLKQSVAEKYVRQMGTIVNYLRKTPAVNGGNPFIEALDTDPFDYDDSTIKLEIPLDQLQQAVFDIKNPTVLYSVVTLLKTGLRRSELVNLDERDINLNHPISKNLDKPRAEVRNKPNSIYVDSSINKGEKHNGEIRREGNKPMSYRVIPLDDELVDVFVWYLSMAPSSSSPANPILRVPGNGGTVGNRLGGLRVYHRVRDWADKYGWHVEGGVTPHWCRHWFTTVLRSRIDDSEIPIGTAKEYVQGLRGDSDNSTIDTYTHDWDVGEDFKTYPEIYRENIPDLLVNHYDQAGIVCPLCGRKPSTVSFSTLHTDIHNDPLCNPCMRKEYLKIINE